MKNGYLASPGRWNMVWSRLKAAVLGTGVRVGWYDPAGGELG